MKKITFFGDIMCEPTVLKGAKKGKTYDFSYVFSGTRSLLEGTDYRIGNLETPLCTKEMGYCDDFADFGCPDTMADALKEAGFDLISTANNHSFDRKEEGLVYTIEQLDKRGIPHTGTFLPDTPREEAYYLNMGDMTVAIIAYTYNTNYYDSGKKCKCQGAYADSVNLLHEQEQSTFLCTISANNWFDRLTKKFLDHDKRGRIKQFFGVPSSTRRPDDRLHLDKMPPYVEKFTADIKKAKEKADFVIFYPHVGGQFDPAPGQFTEYIFEKAVEAGADAVIASHAHVVQRALYKGDTLCVYSLGNFNMDPHSGLVVPEVLPGMGLALNLHLEDKKLVKTTFSITCARLEKGKLITRPVHELYPMLKPKQQKQLKRDVRWVYETVVRQPLTGEFIRDEYELPKEVTL